MPFICILAISMAWVVGCSRPKDPGVYISESMKTIAEMSNNDVIFKVNGKCVKKKDFLRCQRLQAKIYECVGAQRPDAKRQSTEDYVHANEQKVLPMLMQKELFCQAAKSVGLSVTAEDREKMAKTLLAAYGLKSHTLSEARSELGDEAWKILSETVDSEALSQKGVKALCRDGWLHVSAQEITNHLEGVKKFNANAEKMNKRARDMLLKAKAEILGGAKFANVAKKYAELHPEQGKEWQTVEMAELVAEGEAQLRKWLEKANMGDISDPLDMDDGIAIVGLVRKGEGEVPANMEPPTLYTLVRCTMYARQMMEMPTEEEAKEMMAEFKLGEARKEVGAEFYNKSVIEFPNGTNFFAHVEN